MQRTDSFEKILLLGEIKGGRKRDDRERDVWMASPTQWTWVRVNYGSWWWTGRPGMLQSMGLQRIGHGWATELKNIGQLLKWSSSSGGVCVFNPLCFFFNIKWKFLFSCLVAKSCLILWPYGLQHTGLPCPSPSPEVCPCSCILH